ncbi:MAG TPA: helix-turn-helix domain-containing protein [Acidimicrobiales bacterium]|nr:helix-turn-helix domain-containing protein [Acidimicrobiales bacterium]
MDAAATCFAETGFDATSIRAIAERAGTSPETIYAAFGTKVGVLQAWIDQAVTGDDDEIPLREREAFTALAAPDDVDGALRQFVRSGRKINERVAVPIQVARAAAPSSPELAGLLAENERRRHHDFAAAVEHLTRETQIPGGLSVERAAQLVAALGSVDLYRSLVLEAGWTSTEYDDHLVRLIAAVLGLGPSPGRRSRSRPR